MIAFAVPATSLLLLAFSLGSGAFQPPLALAQTDPGPSAQASPLPAPAPASTPAPAASPVSNPPRLEDLQIDRVDLPSGTVFFRYAGSSAKAPGPVRTGIVDLMPIGSIRRSPSELPYFLFTGLPCKDCKDSPNIYIVRPDGRKPSSFIYPGKIVDPENGAVLMQSRAFYGRCLRALSSEVYVVFQQERVDRRRSLQASVFVAEPGPDHLMERLIERRLPRINDTLRLIRQKSCTEISGKYRPMLRKLLDLKPKRDPEKIEEEDSEDDTPPKENQTDRDLAPPQQPEARTET